MKERKEGKKDPRGKERIMLRDRSPFEVIREEELCVCLQRERKREREGETEVLTEVREGGRSVCV